MRLDLIGRPGKLKLERKMLLNSKTSTSTGSVTTTVPRRLLYTFPNLLHPLSPLTMFRIAAVRALRAAAAPQIARNIRLQTHNSIVRSSRFAPSFVLPSIRCYSAPSGLAKEEVQGRIMDLLKNFDKVRSPVTKHVRSSLLTHAGYGCIEGGLILKSESAWQLIESSRSAELLTLRTTSALTV